jgi:hypothetical protein
MDTKAFFTGIPKNEKKEDFVVLVLNGRTEKEKLSD